MAAYSPVPAQQQQKSLLNPPEEEVSIIPPIVASHNTYLEDQTSIIRDKAIPWEGYQRASLITEEDLIQIRQFEKNPKASLSENGDKYVELFLNLLQKLVRPDTIQSILILIDDLITGEFALPLTENEELNKAWLLKKDDEFIQLKSAKVLAALLLNANTQTYQTYDPSELFSWISTKLQDSNPNVVDTVVQILQSILAIQTARIQFYSNNTGMANLVELLRKNGQSAQMQYQVIYCLWLMTFNDDVSADLQRKHNVLPLFIEIAKSAIKEKVVRVIFSTIRNQLAKAPQENLVAMLGNKVLNVCDTLASRKWSDSEISEDLEFIKEELRHRVQSLSTFDEYASEVKSGQLDWSPPHLSEQFWKQNATKLAEKDYELVKILSRLISTTSSPLVLSVASHDLGQFVKHYPTGKRFIQEVGAKTQIMELMSHENADVRYQALLAVQKFMTNAWDY
ncbi:H(+)-transporting V1 sector ATPase subunit H [Phlyctochytrium planicorne]|nr:H(+)-transporting V1 sector ATPase subunit H [Phlyctochytrium planicorne]